MLGVRKKAILQLLTCFTSFATGSLHGGAATLILGMQYRISTLLTLLTWGRQINARHYPSLRTQLLATGSMFPWPLPCFDMLLIRGFLRWVGGVTRTINVTCIKAPVGGKSSLHTQTYSPSP